MQFRAQTQINGTGILWGLDDNVADIGTILVTYWRHQDYLEHLELTLPLQIRI